MTETTRCWDEERACGCILQVNMTPDGFRSRTTKKCDYHSIPIGDKGN